jgi:hypothetical protein
MNAPTPTPANLADLLFHLDSIRKTVAKMHRPSIQEHLGICGRTLLEDIEYSVNEALDPGCFLRNNPELAAQFAAQEAAVLARLAAEKAARAAARKAGG